MNRILSLCLDDEADTIATYIENENGSSLTIFIGSIHDEHFYVPPSSITLSLTALQGLRTLLTHSFIKKRLVVDDNIGLRNLTSGNATLNSEGSVQIATIISGNLVIYEADSATANGYKPTKEIRVKRKMLEDFYKLLIQILGEPVYMKFRYEEKDTKKEAKMLVDVKRNEESKSPTGWDLIK